MSKKRIKPDFQDTESALTLTPEEIRFMIEEIHALDIQAHEYLRITPNSMNLALAAAGAAIALALSDHSSDLLRNFVLLMSPLFIGIPLVYHFNVTSEAAALGEQQDRLSYRVNKALGRPIFVGRVVADLRRCPSGTIALLVLDSVILLAVIVMGLINAWAAGGLWLVGQIIVSALTVVAILVALFEIPLTRIEVNAALDEVFGDTDRPSSASYWKDGWRAAFFMRRKQDNTR